MTLRGIELKVLQKQPLAIIVINHFPVFVKCIILGLLDASLVKFLIIRKIDHTLTSHPSLEGSCNRRQSSSPSETVWKLTASAEEKVLICGHTWTRIRLSADN